MPRVAARWLRCRSCRRTGDRSEITRSGGRSCSASPASASPSERALTTRPTPASGRSPPVLSGTISIVVDDDHQGCRCWCRADLALGNGCTSRLLQGARDWGHHREARAFADNQRSTRSDRSSSRHRRSTIASPRPSPRMTLLIRNGQADRTRQILPVADRPECRHRCPILRGAEGLRAAGSRP